jgi:epoxyqueuosine reductase
MSYHGSVISAQLVKMRALEAGFDLAGIAPLPPPENAELTRQWLEKGYAGEMRYLHNPVREDPRQALSSARTAVCVGLVYNTPAPYSTECEPKGTKEADNNPAARSSGEPAGPRAWISRYAWGHDYHRLMRDRLERFRQAIQTLAPDIEARVYVDTGPVNERALARLSGIGWMGKNTLIINEGKGSWFFLGIVLTNLELAPDLPAPDRCGSCTRCLDACPTHALAAPYVMDASRCLAYLTIELKASIPEEFRRAVGLNVFGCDICQDVCPWNSRSPADFPEMSSRRRVAITEIPEFHPLDIQPQGVDESSMVVPSAFSLFNPPIQDLTLITPEDFRSAFKNSPIRRAKYLGWLRNLCVVVGNSRDRRFRPWLNRMLRHGDRLVVEHAAWGLRQLANSKPSGQTAPRSA